MPYKSRNRIVLVVLLVLAFGASFGLSGVSAQETEAPIELGAGLDFHFGIIALQPTLSGQVVVPLRFPGIGLELAPSFGIWYPLPAVDFVPPVVYLPSGIFIGLDALRLGLAFETNFPVQPGDSEGDPTTPVFELSLRPEIGLISNRPHRLKLGVDFGIAFGGAADRTFSYGFFSAIIGYDYFFL